MRKAASGNIGKTLAPVGENRIHLCGRFTVRLGGVRLEDALPGRQGRTLFAFLVAHRRHLTPRQELLGVLWPDQVPSAADSALAALLAKLRRIVGSDVVDGRHDVRLVLPAHAWIDVEAAQEALHRSESAIALHEWAQAWGPARVASHIAARGFLPGYEAPWISEIRGGIEDVTIRSLECVAAGALAIGGPELAAAERSAKRLTQLAPYRESGYRLLIQALAARESVAEALLVYERLRQILRDELGASPSAATRALQHQLLKSWGLET